VDERGIAGIFLVSKKATHWHSPRETARECTSVFSERSMKMTFYFLNRSCLVEREALKSEFEFLRLNGIGFKPKCGE
jgi:hypothetical protein